MNDSNKKKIESLKGKELFLFDSSAFQIFEEWGLALHFDLLGKIQESPRHHFFITNEVFVELHQKRQPEYMARFFKYILNSEASMSHETKFNLFPVEIDGKIIAVQTNAISVEDFNQVWLCVNHPELSLISNDRKLLKTTAVVLKGRVLGPSTFIRKFIEMYPEDSALKRLHPILQRVKEKKVL